MEGLPVITYKQGYKYQLVTGYSIQVGILDHEIRTEHEFLRLCPEGRLTILAGYAWDGPSGPAIDTKNFMRGSLVHDALYQLISGGHISADFRKHADQLLRQICREDGMSAVRAWWVYQGVRFGGGAAVRQDNPVITAP